MLELIINSGIGEVRVASILDGNPYAVKIFRNTVPQLLGGVYWGRVKNLARDLDGAFIDLGKKYGEAFIPYRHARPIAPKGKGVQKPKNISHVIYEGQLIPIEIIREAIPHDNKLPQVRARRDIFEEKKPPKIPTCITPAPSPTERTILWGGKDAESIIFDDLEAMADAKKSFPDLAKIMKHYKDPPTLFEDYGLSERLDQIKTGISPLPSGGTIRFEETSAIVAIDVNSGSIGKGQASEKVKLQVNIEAAHKIADEIQFQNFGGLMVIDFIDLSRETDRRTLMKVFDGALRVAGVELEKTGLSKFMLMELRHKKAGWSIPRQLNNNPIETEALELLRLGLKEGSTSLPGSLTLEAIPPIIKWLEKNDLLLRQLKQKIGREIHLEVAKASSSRIFL